MKKEIIKKSALFLISACVFAIAPSNIYAEEARQNLQNVWRAKVVNILSDEQKWIPELEIYTRFQKIEAKIIEGPRKEKTVTLENDFLPFEKGDKLFVHYLGTINDNETYVIKEPDRREALFLFIALFMLIVLILGGRQGLKSLLALAASFLILFYFLFPQLLAGASPVLISTIFAIAVLMLATYLTHGLNRKSTSALIGASITILLAILLADFAVRAAKLSGFTEDASISLNIITGGTLDFQGLLLGAMIIGVLGILDDIAVTQAATVKELHSAAPNLSRKVIYEKAISVGKEHVGALINTLAFAYAGAALPLLLLFYSAEPSFLTINREIFATEVIRTVVGSIAIILAVPITTAISVILLVKQEEKSPQTPPA